MRIIITGDATRPNFDGTPHQLFNINWLYNLLREPIKLVTGIEPLKITVTPDFRNTIEEWLKTDLNTRRISWHLRQPEFDYDINRLIVIGFELPKNSLYQFSKLKIKYINVAIHPIRFTQDLIIGVQSNVKLPDEFILDETQLCCALSFKELNLPENTAIIVGQTSIDRSVIKNGKVVKLSDFERQIRKLVTKYNKVLFKPHPLELEPLGIEVIKKYNIETTTENIYDLLAQKNLTHVYGISSSVLYEAKFFGKEVTFWCERRENRYLKPIQSNIFVSSAFWAIMLRPFVEIINEGTFKEFEPDFLRKSCNSWWGYPKKDKTDTLRYTTGTISEEEYVKEKKCLICGGIAYYAIKKLKHPYYSCTGCHALFTPHIDPSVVITENDNPALRHKGSLDCIRLYRMVSYSTNKVQKVVDFGCGQDEYCKFLASQGIECIGIDKFTEIKISKIETESIDGINMVEVIEHLYDYEQEPILREFYRILKPLGVVYIESSFVNSQDLDNWGYLSPAIGHCFLHSENSLTTLAGKVGFSIHKINNNCYIMKKEQ